MPHSIQVSDTSAIDMMSFRVHFLSSPKSGIISTIEAHLFYAREDAAASSGNTGLRLSSTPPVPIDMTFSVS